ncbi:3-oxoacyl-[acyl-carrier-protein] reductase FabG-like [Patiria miniata]|uniref:Ketoreductase domain-containing protein n=1 Tax=Patiria miniata TaxID=46514 RepID=A0A913Z043_PATMI|nr:3-oxoacyl-[acyl-carrier-protein] reductase FabG-like [Patiria miniata]
MSCFLNGRVAIVTGASSGIGAGIARHLAILGCSLVLVGRNEENLRLVQAECVDRGLDEDKILVVKADLGNEKDVKELLKKSIEKFQKVNILVNSAGVLAYGSLEEMTVDQLDSLVAGNLRTLFLVTKHSTPHLAKTKGSIVNISSTSSRRASPGLLGYGMTKAAVDHFTKTVAIELAPKQIRVNAVSPGLTVTPLYKKAAPNWNPTDDNLEEEGKRWHPLGRACTVEDIARCVAFLVSDEASFTTGQIIPVDGGRHVAQSLR